MANAPKQHGTRFESAVVWYLQEQAPRADIMRQALAGAFDQGDIIFNINGHKGIIECKYRKGGAHSPSDIEEYKRQTLAEKENAGVNLAALVINDKSGASSKGSKGVGLSRCYVQLYDFLKLTGMRNEEIWHLQYFMAPQELWVCIPLEHFTKYLTWDK